MTAVTRAHGPVITGPEEFSLLWPSLFDRVVATLRQRGVDWASAEDAVQEAGARALANQVPYTSEHDLRRWVQTVAWRVAVDNHRRTTRWRAPWGAGGRVADGGGGLSAMGGADAGPERITTSVDVAHEVEARFELKAVERMFPLLSAADRAALVDSAPAGQTRKEAVRLAVRRHRARAKLVALVEGLASAIGFLPWRRLGAWRAAIIPSVAAATLVPLVLIAPPLLDQGDGDGRGRGTEANRGVLVQTTSNGASPAASQPSDSGNDAEAGAHHDAGPRGRAGRPTSTPAPDDTGTNGGLSFRAGIPGPPGEPDQGETGVRPKEEGKPLFCVTAPTTGRVCTPDRQVEDTLSANGL